MPPKKGLCFSNTGKPGILEGVLYCPESPANLLSVKKFQMAGYQTIFHVDGSISIKGKDNVIIISNTNENIPNLFQQKEKFFY